MLRSRRASFALLACSLLLFPDRASAHGLHGHVHVTGWAIENLPPGELKDFFADPAVFQAALMGAAFPDTGYAVGNETARNYAEAAHWEPFLEQFIQHVRTHYGPTYTDDERLVVAFLLGCASHGLQDELFDSTFLYELEQRDMGDQSNADPGTDGFLAQDGHLRLFPERYVPMDDLLALYATVDPAIDADLIDQHVSVVLGAYVNDGFGVTIATNNGAAHRDDLPWTALHYLDPAVPGSLRAEITPTGRHMQALWDRLHDRFTEEDLVVHAWPDAPRRLREADHTSVASWVTLVLGKGVMEGTASGTLVDAVGTPHPFALAGTRWGGTSRIVRFQPTADFVPGARYTATLSAGATLVDGTVTALAHAHEFQVECATPDDAACPDVGEIDDPRIDGMFPEPSDGGGCAVAHPGAPASRGATALALLAAAALAVARRGRRRARDAA